ncbi:hypothetical protein TNCV_2742011 [Trichonephila clavipes]|nr:hypothetical protein TNCV_2742011 [Trichonephila clavipes]
MKHKYQIRWDKNMLTDCCWRLTRGTRSHANNRLEGPRSAGLSRFSGNKFRSSIAKGALRSSESRAQNELKSALSVRFHVHQPLYKMDFCLNQDTNMQHGCNITLYKEIFNLQEVFVVYRTKRKELE